MPVGPYTEIRQPIRPSYPAVPRKLYVLYPTLLRNWSTFYPASSSEGIQHTTIIRNACYAFHVRSRAHIDKTFAKKMTFVRVFFLMTSEGKASIHCRTRTAVPLGHCCTQLAVLFKVLTNQNNTSTFGAVYMFTVHHCIFRSYFHSCSRAAINN